MSEIRREKIKQGEHGDCTEFTEKSLQDHLVVSRQEMAEHRLKPVPLVAGKVGGAKVEVGMEFAFEESGAAFGIADVFGSVAANTELDGDSAALE